MIGKKTGGLLLAGLAGYVFYKYKKMTPEQRTETIAGLKEKGQKFYDDFVPGEIKNMFRKKETQAPGSRTTGIGNEFVI